MIKLNIFIPIPRALEMSEPKKNVYTHGCKINNWVEEEATREAVIKAYVELKQKGDLKAREMERDLENIMAPVELPQGAQLVFPGDYVIGLIHTEQFPLCISSDVRFPHFDYRAGYVCSLSREITAARRHVLQLVRVDTFTTQKMGRRLDPNKATLLKTYEREGREPLRYGDKFYLLAHPDMIDYATKERTLERYALGVTTVVGSPKMPIVLGPLSKLAQDAEFIVEDFQQANRLEFQGQPVPYNRPLVLRHVVTGQCIGCGMQGPTRFPLDIKSEEYHVICKSILTPSHVEGQNNCFTFCCDSQ